MSYWAEIDKDNKVLRVTVGDDNDANGDKGYQWLVDNLGGTWIETTQDSSLRKNYADKGFTYDATRDAFIAPKPDNATGFDEDTCQWIVPDTNEA
jgi:hypothetical protein